jgi:hypothetical protein
MTGSLVPRWSHVRNTHADKELSRGSSRCLLPQPVRGDRGDASNSGRPHNRFPGPWSVSMISDNEDVFHDRTVRFTPEDSSLFIYDGGEALYLEKTSRQDPLYGVEMRIQHGTRDLVEGFYPFAMSYKNPDAFYTDPIGSVHVTNDGTNCPVDQTMPTFAPCIAAAMASSTNCGCSLRCDAAAWRPPYSARSESVTRPHQSRPIRGCFAGWPPPLPAPPASRCQSQSSSPKKSMRRSRCRDRDSFVLKGTTCTEPGERQCQVTVGYRPQTVGVKRAQVHLEGGTASRVVPLSGYAQPGRTSLAIDSEAGDPIGEGEEFFYSARRVCFIRTHPVPGKPCRVRREGRSLVAAAW